MKERTQKSQIAETKQIMIDKDFGFREPGSSSYDKVFFVKPLLKNQPHFEISWKEGDDRYVSTSKEIQGELMKIEESEYVYEDKLIETLKLHIKWELNGAPVLFIIGTAFTNISRGLINTLLSVNEPITNIKLVLYEKDGYPALYTRINKEKAGWKYQWDELKKKVVEIKNPKTKEVVQRDYTELNDFLKSELLNHLDKIVSITPTTNFVEKSEGDEDMDSFFDNIDE